MKKSWVFFIFFMSVAVFCTNNARISWSEWSSEKESYVISTISIDLSQRMINDAKEGKPIEYYEGGINFGGTVSSYWGKERIYREEISLDLLKKSAKNSLDRVIILEKEKSEKINVAIFASFVFVTYVFLRRKILFIDTPSVIMAAIPKSKICPFCLSRIKKTCTVCRYGGFKS